MRQVRNGGESGREAISRVEKSTTKRYADRADPSRQVLPKLQGVEH